MKYLRHLNYVVRHKWFVFLETCRLGIPWLGIVHDLSKLRPSEWGPYAGFMHVKKTTNVRDKTGYFKPTDTGNAAFDFAWLLHQKRNRHHWQYWCLPNGDGGMKVMAMPDRYLREMVADWRGAGRAQGKPDTKAWYAANGGTMQLHPDTREIVEALLGVSVQPTSQLEEGNVCCPLLNINACGDTDDHQHFTCEDGPIPGNDWVRLYCLDDVTWGGCPYLKGQSAK